MFEETCLNYILQVRANKYGFYIHIQELNLSVIDFYFLFYL